MSKTLIVTGVLIVGALGGASAVWQAHENWQEPIAMPVVGATPRDWHPETFWYEPWGESLVHKGMDIFAERGTPVVAATNHIILSINEKPVRSNGEYISWLYNYRPGENITLNILRENQEVEISMNLEKY